MTTYKKELIVVGSGGHARVLIDAAEDAGYRTRGIIDLEYKNQNESILDYPVLGSFDVMDQFDPKETCVIMALGNGHQRAEYFNKVQSLGFPIPFVVHPTSIVSKHVKIGNGVFINAGAIINVKAVIGDNTIINTGAIIEHEVNIGNHSHICPGVKVAGRVTIGDYCVVGIGSCVIDYINIGNNVKIGAGSVIIRDIVSNSTIVGVPGKRIK